MNKKIIILLLLALLIIAGFLLVLSFKMNSNAKKQPVIQQNITEKKVDIRNLLFNITQDKNGLLLNFSTQDFYSCADLNYDFSVNQEQSLIKLDLKYIMQEISCDSNERQIEKKEKIGEIKNWTLDINYGNKNIKYAISIENNSVKISNINNSEDLDILKFENQNYILLPSNIVRLRVDYYDKNVESSINSLLNRLNVAKKEIIINEAELAFTNLTSEAFKSNAPYSIVKYFSYDDESVFKNIVTEFKKNDCYIDNPDYKNCISIDFRTSSGARYCTWLNVSY